jgi:hypothetical protein
MAPPPKDPDKIPKPRPSRAHKSGKPPAPPPETAAGTPEVRARGKAGRKPPAPIDVPGFAEAPQVAFTAHPVVSDPEGQTPVSNIGGAVGVRPSGSDTAEAPPPTN